MNRGRPFRTVAGQPRAKRIVLSEAAENDGTAITDVHFYGEMAVIANSWKPNSVRRQFWHESVVLDATEMDYLCSVWQQHKSAYPKKPAPELGKGESA